MSQWRILKTTKNNPLDSTYILWVAPWSFQDRINKIRITSSNKIKFLRFVFLRCTVSSSLYIFMLLFGIQKRWTRGYWNKKRDEQEYWKKKKRWRRDNFTEVHFTLLIYCPICKGKITFFLVKNNKTESFNWCQLISLQKEWLMDYNHLFFFCWILYELKYNLCWRNIFYYYNVGAIFVLSIVIKFWPNYFFFIFLIKLFYFVNTVYDNFMIKWLREKDCQNYGWMFLFFNCKVPLELFTLKTHLYNLILYLLAQQILLESLEGNISNIKYFASLYGKIWF